jgi:hypothetical protein
VSFGDHTSCIMQNSSATSRTRDTNGNLKASPNGWMDVHDFPSDALGKAIPYGIYAVAADAGFVRMSIEEWASMLEDDPGELVVPSNISRLARPKSPLDRPRSVPFPRREPMSPAPLPSPPALAARRLRRAGLILGVAVGISLGCSSPIPGIVRQAEAERFCPAPRIVVKARDDLTVHQMVCAEPPRWRALREDNLNVFWERRGNVSDAYCGEALPEVRGDPARLRLFQELRDRQFSAFDRCGPWASLGCTVHIFEVSACGARILYGCEEDRCFRMGLVP